MKNKATIAGFGTFLLAVPSITYGFLHGTNLFTLLLVFSGLIKMIVPVIIGLAVLFFLWGLMRYILQTDSVEGRAAARQIMFWGVITIFVMVSIWGFVNVLDGLFGLNTGAPTYPKL